MNLGQEQNLSLGGHCRVVLEELNALKVFGVTLLIIVI